MYKFLLRGVILDHADDFSQNWRIQGENNRPLDETTIDQFIATHGREQAIGYIRAIQDFVNELEYGLFDTRPEFGTSRKPLTRVRNNFEKLYLHKSNFLSYVNENQILNPDPQPD
ncbi:hypothetical protein [Mucilaginibacter sp. SJ]|uniref:hypothetical protein n=1 Tax=Mucilaginibacter sp. SJ TaxID=3029053 RepID=UPI0023A91EED|nr:hypothetical protein [Mucilaginibacter sp. SJ]WEA01819.1 hypothetical protein MusilaSJ_02635 [Mucilaginibacter sp. SJ]